MFWINIISYDDLNTITPRNFLFNRILRGVIMYIKLYFFPPKKSGNLPYLSTTNYSLACLNLMKRKYLSLIINT
jgi:hypothetical protein